MNAPLFSRSYLCVTPWSQVQRWRSLKFQRARLSTTAISKKIDFKHLRLSNACISSQRRSTCFPLTRAQHFKESFNGSNEHRAALSSNCKSDSGSESTNNLSRFYEGRTILITGATGFIGKVLVEKLLRSCGSLEKIYVLLRPKKGFTIEQRLDQLLQSPIFDRIRNHNIGQLKKVKPLHGDIGEPLLGLGDSDRRLAKDTIDVVFHSAATIRFVEDLPDAIRLNVVGTKEVAELCKDMKNLRAFIHVSTAFSNVPKAECDEIVYDAPFDPEFLMKMVKTLPLHAVKVITPTLLGDHPNTYTFSKCLAENVVQGYSKVLPAAIVRPSLVNSSWKEPFPGWVDSLASVTGATAEIARGTFRSILGNSKLTLDLIPVDVVANTLIAAAWHTATNKSETMRVYNCTCQSVNEITLGDFSKRVVKYAREFPSKHALFYPNCSTSSSKIVHEIRKVLLHYTPAYILDSYFYFTGRKPKMVSCSKKMTTAWKSFDLVLLQKRNFHANTFKKLMESVKQLEDGKNFDMDITKSNGFDWDDYLKTDMLSVRQRIFGEDISSLDKARTKLKQLYWATRALQAISAGALVSFAFW